MRQSRQNSVFEQRWEALPKSPERAPLLIPIAGDADGLGETRKKELVKSGLQLGLRNEADILVVEDE